LQGVNCYLLKAGSGFVLIDTGFKSNRSRLEKELAGAADEVSARLIGKRVFGRGSDFDPNKDPIIRIEAGKLRRDLEIYYLASGRHDPLHISIPKGRYRPVFAYRT